MFLLNSIIFIMRTVLVFVYLSPSTVYKRRLMHIVMNNVSTLLGNYKKLLIVLLFKLIIDFNSILYYLYIVIVIKTNYFSVFLLYISNLIYSF